MDLAGSLGHASAGILKAISILPIRISLFDEAAPDPL
jgi:hypothetical protein